MKYEALSNLIGQIISTSPGQQFENLVYIGAGQLEDVEVLRSIQCKNIWLIEGDELEHEKIAQRITSSDTLKIICAIVTPEGNPVQWHRFNLPRFNGPKPLDPKVLKFYPRLSVISNSKEKTVSLPELCSTLGLNNTKANILILDLPGQEIDFLQRTSQFILENFESVIINHSTSSSLALQWPAASPQESPYFKAESEVSTARTNAAILWKRIPLAKELRKKIVEIKALKETISSQQDEMDKLRALEQASALKAHDLRQLQEQIVVKLKESSAANLKITDPDVETIISCISDALSALETLKVEILEKEKLISKHLEATASKVEEINTYKASIGSSEKTQQTLRDEAQQCNAEKAKLEAQVRLLRQEVSMCEGQLKLITDVLLRESDL